MQKKVEFKIIYSQRAKNLLYDDKYRYVINRKKKGFIYWRCKSYSSKTIQCRSTARTSVENLSIGIIFGSHTCSHHPISDNFEESTGDNLDNSSAYQLLHESCITHPPDTNSQQSSSNSTLRFCSTNVSTSTNTMYSRASPTTSVSTSSKQEEEEYIIPYLAEVDEEYIRSYLTNYLTNIEKRCTKLRYSILDELQGVRDTLKKPSLVFRSHCINFDPYTNFKELYPASINDINMWHLRELRICLEWAKTFLDFIRLNDSDQLALIREFGFTFNTLNRAFYSLNYGPDKIVYPNGAYIDRDMLRQETRPGCLNYDIQMDRIMIPFRKLDITIAEFSVFKAVFFFNPDAVDLSKDAKENINEARKKLLSALFYLITSEIGLRKGVEKYHSLLMITFSVLRVQKDDDENMQVNYVFGTKNPTESSIRRFWENFF